MNPRRHYFIHKRFQADFTRKMLVAVFVPVIICSAFFVLYLSVWSLQSGIHLNGIFTGGVLPAMLIRALPVIFFIVVFSILFSHRIAGPIRRMQKVCAGLAEGLFPGRIFLRKRDYFQHLAEKFNQLHEISSLHQ